MEILFVDDNVEEAFSFKRAISNLSAKIHVSHITYCSEVLLVATMKRPDIIFLGSTISETKGITFLRKIRSLKEYGRMPVIMYTSSISDTKIESSYQARANYYVVRPEGLSQTVSTLSRFIHHDLKVQKRISKEEFIIQ